MTTSIPHGVCPDTERWIPLPFGGVFAFDGKDPEGTSYVRVLALDGYELGYWSVDEWTEPGEGEFVMGAICGAMLSDDMPHDCEGKYYQFGPNTTFPEGVSYERYHSREQD